MNVSQTWACKAGFGECFEKVHVQKQATKQPYLDVASHFEDSGLQDILLDNVSKTWACRAGFGESFKK